MKKRPFPVTLPVVAVMDEKFEYQFVPPSKETLILYVLSSLHPAVHDAVKPPTPAAVFAVLIAILYFK